jgi:4-hydroxybenzoate polyprenyltransferase
VAAAALALAGSQVKPVSLPASVALAVVAALALALPGCCGAGRVLNRCADGCGRGRCRRR